MNRTLLSTGLGLLLGLALAGGALADGDAAAHVTYVTGSSVYVDAGSDDGLRQGDQLRIVRDGAVVAELEVTEVSNRRAACALGSAEVEIRVGDEVAFSAPAAVPADTGDERTKQESRRRKRSLRGPGIHGRVGVRYLAARDRAGDGPQYAQPGVDLRLDGEALGGGPWNLAVDVRTRRTYRDHADGTSDDDSRSRVYRLAVGFDGQGPWNVVAGRQFQPALAAVSTFDGVSASFDRERFSVGGFTGTQPDPEDYGHSSDVKEHGVYAQWRGAPEPRRAWSLTTGLIGSYQESEVNREFFYLQGRYGGRRLSAYLTSEVDFNRDWKQDEAGESSVSLTSGFLSLHYRVTDTFRLRGGFDNRRNVRLYRDRVTPETDFDDAFRRGGWVGASWRLRNRYSFAVDARSNRGGDAGTANTYTATAGVSRLTRAMLGVHVRATRYENPRIEGWLYSLSAGLDVGSRVYAQLSAGTRDESNLANSVFDDSITWYGVDVDVTLSRRIYLLFSLERTSGDFEEVDQLFARLAYRF